MLFGCIRWFAGVLGVVLIWGVFDLMCVVLVELVRFFGCFCCFSCLLAIVSIGFGLQCTCGCLGFLLFCGGFCLVVLGAGG